MKSLDDTLAEAQEAWTKVFHVMPLSRKWQLLDEAFAGARMFHAAGWRLSHPGATTAEIHHAWLKAHWGLEVSEQAAMTHSCASLTGVLREVLEVLTKLDIVYALGGSMASSIHGIARFTLDADLTVEPFPGKEEDLAKAFGSDYYLSLPAIQDAVRLRSSFNIINTSAGFKVDVFVRKDDPFEQSALARRQMVTLNDKPEQPIAVLSPEDVILFKLQWYRLGNETSRQQLDDILGILRTRPGNLDESYVTQWAQRLALTDLWDKVLTERG